MARKARTVKRALAGIAVLCAAVAAYTGWLLKGAIEGPWTTR